MQGRGGIVIGPSHAEGSTHFRDAASGAHVEEEGMEVNIPGELLQDNSPYTFYGTNAQVLDQILNLAGLGMAHKVTAVKNGDIVICKRSAWDDDKRTFSGTIAEILNKINTSKGCKPIARRQITAYAKNGGRITLAQKLKDWETENPNSPRWIKKKERIQELSNSIQRLRMNISRDMASDDEKTALTALIIAVMDRTAERVGNDDSADNGHFGVTGFRKKHISVVGNKVHLDYIGKSGMKQEKSFSDERIAKALKKAIKNSPGKFIFETSDGFRIKSDKVNRYLEQYNITAKDLRGYLANKWIIAKLQVGNKQLAVGNEQPEKAKKERKKIFNKALKETALEVGHGKGTLRKHYMIPELPVEYIEHGRIIDMKNLGYYKDGGSIECKLWGKNKHPNAYKNNFVKNNGMKQTVHKKEQNCFSSYLTKNNADLCERIKKENINEVPELRQQMDEAYKGWKENYNQTTN